MKTVKMPVAKKAIQELKGEELEVLAKFKKSEEFRILTALADLEKYKRYQTDFLTARSIEDVNFYRGINVGIDFIMDSVNRAKEELINRGVKEDEFDNDKNIK